MVCLYLEPINNELVERAYKLEMRLINYEVEENHKINQGYVTIHAYISKYDLVARGD